MPNITQTESGKAWEYGLAKRAAEILQVPLIENQPKSKAEQSYQLFNERNRKRIDHAAGEIICFLRSFDKNIDRAMRVTMQSDMAGAEGDVRDIIIDFDNGSIGISAKHRHEAIKHSRLSHKIDFGKIWYGIPCSNRYWETVRPIFEELGERKQKSEIWSRIPDKNRLFYQPILNAFMLEIKEYANPTSLMTYLLGRFDFYKVIKINGDVSVYSFNMGGTLGWGDQVKLPDQIIGICLDKQSTGTVHLTMNRGWQVSLRLHNASSKVEPSLKFDINLVGSPTKLRCHVIPYG